MGCGKVANVLESPDAGERGRVEHDAGATSSGGDRTMQHDGGIVGPTGEGGATGGGAQPSSAGNGPLGDGGTSARMTGADAAIAAGGAPGAAGTAGVVASLDPHAAERTSLATQACKIFDANKCLTQTDGDIPVTNGDEFTVCEDMVETNESDIAGNNCWDQWVANVKCGIARTDWCPCTGNDCLFQPWNGIFGAECAQTYNALEACIGQNHTSGTVTGKDGKCNWDITEQGCYAGCLDDPKALFESDCMGSPGGAQECSCRINGVFLGDQAQFIKNQGAYSMWPAQNCANVAQQLADGLCSDILNCCFTWTYYDSPDSGPIEDCGCTADPTQAGYDSCEAMAAAGHGKVVDFCSRYRPDPGSFPVPPSQ